MEHEETGEAVRCPICGTEEYGDCGHLLATLDLTFGECEGGAFYDVVDEFSSAVEEAFFDRHRTDTDRNFVNIEIEQIWENTEFEEDEEHGAYWMPWRPGLMSFYSELLTNAGAISAGFDTVHNGPPGMSSHYSELFAHDHDHDAILSKAKGLLLENLKPWSSALKSGEV